MFFPAPWPFSHFIAFSPMRAPLPNHILIDENGTVPTLYLFWASQKTRSVPKQMETLFMSCVFEPDFGSYTAWVYT